MKHIKSWLLALVALLCVSMPATVSAQITNPSFTGVNTTISNGFNLGLSIALAAAVALLVFGFFFRAAKRRG